VKARLDIDENLVEELATRAASWSGFTRDAIHIDAIRRAASACLLRNMTAKQLLERAMADDPVVVSEFRQAICVGETYFHRSPEHFSFIADRSFAPHVAAGGQSYRAWSAACSTGEEAYSIAACLRAAVPIDSNVQLEVLGTDFSPASIHHAKLAEYGPWSIRETAPIPHPLTHRTAAGRIAVNPDIRAVTQFAVHDLLDPLPARFGEFNLIVCRNVLVYFAPEAIQLAVKHLASRLVPGGLLVFGLLEVGEPPPGLVAVGGPGITAFTRPTKTHTIVPARPAKLRTHSRPPPSKKKARWPSVKPPAKRSLRPEARVSLPPVLKSLPVEIKSKHMHALVLIEGNQRREALTVLGEIRRRAPSYVAACLDQALLCQKSGQRKMAMELMHEVLRLTSTLSVDTLLPGLEDLPVSYYRSAAETFLTGAKKDR
jgi:chemotaxis methyl-accepting protein methylase